MRLLSLFSLCTFHFFPVPFLPSSHSHQMSIAFLPSPFFFLFLFPSLFIHHRLFGFPSLSFAPAILCIFLFSYCFYQFSTPLFPFLPFPFFLFFPSFPLLTSWNIYHRLILFFLFFPLYRILSVPFLIFLISNTDCFPSFLYLSFTAFYFYSLSIVHKSIILPILSFSSFPHQLRLPSLWTPFHITSSLPFLFPSTHHPLFPSFPSSLLRSITIKSHPHLVVFPSTCHLSPCCPWRSAQISSQFLIYSFSLVFLYFPPFLINSLHKDHLRLARRLNGMFLTFPALNFFLHFSR